MKCKDCEEQTAVFDGYCDACLCLDWKESYDDCGGAWGRDSLKELAPASDAAWRARVLAALRMNGEPSEWLPIMGGAVQYRYDADE